MSFLKWKPDIDKVSINVILLLEKIQLEMLPHYERKRPELAAVFHAYPYLAWFVRNKAPKMNSWLDELLSEFPTASIELKSAEQEIIYKLEDWITYVTSPSNYDNLPFMEWDEEELTGITDFSGKIVIDVGSGTGKQALAAAGTAKCVYCVEPIENLRSYIREKAQKQGLNNVYTVDGLINTIPFHDGFADIAMCGHVSGSSIENDIAELERVLKPGGMIIFCPGEVDRDTERHKYLIEHGFEYSRFLEPGDSPASGWKRKYWKIKG